MTIKDLSALSGYSLGTVSRVLNGQPNVSEKARNKILAIAREHGFTLNANAKNLKQTWSNSLLAVVRGVQNELFAMLVERLECLASQGPFQLAVDYIDEQDDEVARAITRIREIKPRGVLFLGGNERHFVARFGEIRIPAVLVSNSAAGFGFGNLSSVTTDDEAAAKEVVDRLLAAGHSRIAVIGGDREQSDISRLRYTGCLDAFRERELVFDSEKNYETSRFSFAGGYAAMEALLGRCPDITAVFAMSDVMAIGAARALRDAGRAIPEDISLVGFDGLPICRYVDPRLTTVYQDLDAMAEESYTILMAAIEGTGSAAHCRIPYRLEENGSVRALARSGEERI